MSNIVDISIIIPVYNEEGNLLELYKQLSATLSPLRKDYELIFINDGSTDNSSVVLQDIQHTGAKVRIVTFDRNYGMTSALDAGFKHAKGNFILTIDADLQFDCNDLVRIFHTLQDCDIVICGRCNRKEVDGLVKAISAGIGHYIRDKVLGDNLGDFGALRGFRKAVLKDLVLYRGFQFFIPSLLNIHGYRIKKIQIHLKPRVYGYSKFNIRNRLWKELGVLCVVWWMKKNRLHYNIISKQNFND